MCAESGDHANALRCGQRMVPERFASIDIGKVDFDSWDRDGGDGVVDGDGGVAVASRVNDDGVGPAYRLLDQIDDFALQIGLRGAHFSSPLPAAPHELGIDFREGQRTVVLRLAPAEEV